MEIVLAVAAVSVGAATIVIYNRLVSARLRVKEAWSSIDVQLQRRASLIPNLVEVVKGYAAFERDILTRVIEARGALRDATGPRAAAQANDEMGGALGRLFALVESYPALKADEQFARLQRELADTEDTIAFARNYYNGAVELYNTRVQTIPGMLVARPFGFKPAEFFSAGEAARAPVNV